MLFLSIGSDVERQNDDAGTCACGRSGPFQILPSRWAAIDVKEALLVLRVSMKYEENRLVDMYDCFHIPGARAHLAGFRRHSSMCTARIVRASSAAPSSNTTNQVQPLPSRIPSGLGVL